MNTVAEKAKEIDKLGFNKEKTQELISNLTKDGVSIGIEDLGTYIREQGLIVKVHIGRKRNYVEVSPKIFGVDLEKEGNNVKEFFKEHMKMGKMSFIPDSDEKNLVNIESSVRMQKRRNTIGYDDSFMTLPLYEEFQEMFEDKKKEYFGVRDDIVSRWELLIARFKELLSIALDELHTIDKDKVYHSVISKLPTKEEYLNSFYMTISAKAFPVTENLDMFSNDIQLQIKEGLNQETIATLYDIVGNTLNDAFENVNKIIIAVNKSQSGKIAGKTLGAIKKSAKRIAQKNIFNNKKIDSIKDSILYMISGALDEDEMVEEAEIILSKIYGYAMELNIDSTIDIRYSSLSEAELLEIYEVVGGIKVTDQENEQITTETLLKISA
ncbi:MAG: hypothetical protein K0R54_652 [Clostridiaceae bacterium]|jgi:hypothetical protein|nr:hypothetical protein [Clostridiaceae bacterium]